jgi:cbb3-type cytochrome oxidase subunit 3
MNALLLWGQKHSILLMVASFLVILATMYWPGRRAPVERHALIPLQDDR